MNIDPIIRLFEDLKVALQAKNRENVNQIIHAFIEHEFPIGDRWLTLSQLAQHNGEYDLAAACTTKLNRETNNDPHAQFQHAAVLAKIGRLQEASVIMSSLPADVPDKCGNAYIRGTIAVNLGSIEEAQGHLRRAIKANPQSGQAMLSLAASEMLKVGNSDGDMIINAQKVMANAPAIERAHWLYAKGRVHFDRAEIDDAFAAFSEGAKLVGTWRPYDADADAANAAACRDGFSSDQIAKIANRCKYRTNAPIFVTGLPRSGTTLVEQILVSHSDVTGGEELGKMAIVERELEKIGAQDGQVLLYNDSDKLAQLYVHLARQRFSGKARFVDKSLSSSRQMGLIAAILPDAPIVWMKRNPLDCAWSAFRTYFLKGLDWSWDLKDIAYHFKLEDDMCQHWQSILGKQILFVEYEQLVSDPETAIARIAAHCQLDVQPAMLSPHETRRIVSTASVMQVREPITTSAIDAAGPYKRHLQPFIDCYFDTRT
jgi:tetratricopeptide (TPR) repeat protein